VSILFLECFFDWWMMIEDAILTVATNGYCIYSTIRIMYFIVKYKSHNWLQYRAVFFFWFIIFIYISICEAGVSNSCACSYNFCTTKIIRLSMPFIYILFYFLKLGSNIGVSPQYTCHILAVSTYIFIYIFLTSWRTEVWLWLWSLWM